MKMVAMMVMIGLGFDANDKHFFGLVEMARDVVLGGSLLFTHLSGGKLLEVPNTRVAPHHKPFLL